MSPTGREKEKGGGAFYSRLPGVHSTTLLAVPLTVLPCSRASPCLRPASSPALGPLWLHKWCSHGQDESARWEME